MKRHLSVITLLLVILSCIDLYSFFLLTNSYGDMPAHNLLWRECAKSSDSVTARLAVIPLVQVLSHLVINAMLIHFTVVLVISKLLLILEIKLQLGEV